MRLQMKAAWLFKTQIGLFSLLCDRQTDLQTDSKTDLQTDLQTVMQTNIVHDKERLGQTDKD